MEVVVVVWSIDGGRWCGSEWQHFDDDEGQAEEGNYGDEAKSLSHRLESWRKIWIWAVIFWLWISQSCSNYFYRLNKQENDSPHVCYRLEIYSCLPHVQDTVMMGSEYCTLLWCTIFIRFLKIFRFQYLNTSLGSGEWAWIDPKQSVSNMDRSNCMVRLRSLDMSMSSHCRFSRLRQPVLPAVVLS